MSMERVDYCPLCRGVIRRGDRWSECTCTTAQLDRYHKECELESARATVARLERELGVQPARGGNRTQRRAAASKRRRG